MAKKLTPEEPVVVPAPLRDPEIDPEEVPGEPVIIPGEGPDVIPDENPFVEPPYEVPPPGEGP